MASHIGNILVRAPNWIGDQIIAYPFFYYLRKAYPEAKITVACVPWVSDVQFMDLIDDVYRVTPAEDEGLWAKFRNIDRHALELKRRAEWDLAFSLPNSFSAAWLLYRSGARRRRGYRADGRGFLFNEGMEWDRNPTRHRAQAYVDLLPAEARPERQVRGFWGKMVEGELDGVLPGELEKFPAERSWHQVRAIEPHLESYWVLAPGATADSRRWPLGNFIRLARMIAEKTGWKGLIVGGPKEVELAAELRRYSDLPLVDFTAKGPVTGLWKIFRNAKFTICNESGLAHVAALCGSPVQIICGAADPRRTQPLGPGAVQVAVNAVECWPCEKNHCLMPPEKEIQCLRGISPESVWEEVRNGFIAKTSADLRA